MTLGAREWKRGAVTQHPGMCGSEDMLCPLPVILAFFLSWVGKKSPVVKIISLKSGVVGIWYHVLGGRSLLGFSERSIHVQLRLLIFNRKYGG